MPKQQKQQEEKQSAQKESLRGFVFHVMPKEYIGASTEAPKQPVQKKEAPKTKPKPVPPPVPKPPVKPVQPPKQGAKKSSTALIIVLLVLFLLAASAAAYIYFMPRELESPEQVLLPEPPQQITPEPVAPRPVIAAPGSDTDSDGLTDIEERLYGSEFRNPDTDADSFLDGNEIFHRYDPLSPDPALLIDSNAVTEFVSNGPVGFSILVPKQWIIRPVQSEANRTLAAAAAFDLSTGTDATIHIDAWDLNDQTLEEYFASAPLTRYQDAGLEDRIPRSAYIDFINQEGVMGFHAVNKRTMFLEFEGYLFRFEYDLGSDIAIEYLQTFQMIVNSFKSV